MNVDNNDLSKPEDHLQELHPLNAYYQFLLLAEDKLMMHFRSPGWYMVHLASIFIGLAIGRAVMPPSQDDVLVR